MQQPDYQEDQSFGVFKPRGHVVISLPTAAAMDEADRALRNIGLQGDAIRRYTDKQMLRQIDHDLEDASPLASIGQELNLIKAHRALAEQGYHWLVVRAEDDELAIKVAETVRPLGAERAQFYGRFIIEELIEPGDGLPQVAESPDRGLDAQTPSGEEDNTPDQRPGSTSR